MYDLYGPIDYNPIHLILSIFSYTDEAESSPRFATQMRIGGVKATANRHTMLRMERRSRNTFQHQRNKYRHSLKALCDRMQNPVTVSVPPLPIIFISQEANLEFY